ncbi:hypothetical protein NQ315_012579 [Exocentrus adspersus]|uniref:Uncharacterized protein n=1 Tax=Exocentrus adspersus TaxID=1586481 RepID=A0AAV8VEL2_9CUCU|nr:hypothetical protein NQ315_012579 [Exocentrus adspersus]
MAILNLYKFHPYHTTLYQELHGQDFENRATFCNWVITQMQENDRFLNNVVFSDKTTFHNCGQVKTASGGSSYEVTEARPHLKICRYPLYRVNRKRETACFTLHIVDTYMHAPLKQADILLELRPIYFGLLIEFASSWHLGGLWASPLDDQVELYSSSLGDGKSDNRYDGHYFLMSTFIEDWQIVETLHCGRS